jgi:molybdopterin converting factor small subunit
VKITVRPIGIVREFTEKKFELFVLTFDSTDIPLGRVFQELKLDPKLVTGIVVNGKTKKNEEDLVLHDGDEVSLIPYLAGG